MSEIFEFLFSSSKKKEKNSPLSYRRQRLRRSRRPLQDLLAPVHPHEAVHLAQVDQLPLRRVPELVVRLRVLQLRPRVGELARVRGVQLQALAGPGRGAVEGVVPVGLEVAEVVRELLPDDELFQEALDRLARRRAAAVLCSLQGGALGPELPEVEVRGQVGLRGGVARVVALGGVLLEARRLQKRRESLRSSFGPGTDPEHLRHCSPRDQRPPDDGVPLRLRGLLQ